MKRLFNGSLETKTEIRVLKLTESILNQNWSTRANTIVNLPKWSSNYL